MEAPDVDIHVRLQELQPDRPAAGRPGRGGPVRAARLHRRDASRACVRVLPEPVGLDRSLWLVTHQDLKALARIRAVTDFMVEAVKASRASFLGGEA